MRSSSTGESRTPRVFRCSAMAPDSANRTSKMKRSSASDRGASAKARANGEATSGNATVARRISLRSIIAPSSFRLGLERREPFEQQLLLERQVADELFQMQV